MKKGFIFISFLMAACLALTGCSSESEPFEAKSYTPDVPVSGIELDVRDRAVEVTISEDQHVHIEYSENSKKYYDIAVSEDNILTVTGASDKGLSDYVGGKPSDEEEAFRMLDMLQGNTHQVYTGVTLVFSNGGAPVIRSFYEKTDVTFYPIDRADLLAYADSKDPLDKAGAYGIQGPFAIHVKKIHGDYNNVVGLPIARLYQELKTFPD